MICIQEKIARKLCLKMGYKKAMKWSFEKLQTKIKNLPKVISSPTPTGSKQLDNELIKVFASAGDITVTPTAKENTMSTKTKTKTDKKKTKSKTKPVTKKKSDKKKTRVEGESKKKSTKKKASKDTYGCRLGTESAAINAEITSKGVTAEAICEATGLSLRRVKSHIGTMLRKKLYAKTDKGTIVPAE